jgi:hypothetical protein
VALELDHIFCFCEPELAEVKLLENAGFVFNSGRIHSGQGTANRCLVFEQNYFELIYLHSEDDAKKNPLGLYARAKWKESNASPFGIGLRGKLSKEDKSSFWEYEPPYKPGTIIYDSHYCIEHPDAPMIFVMDQGEKTLESMRPKKIPEIDKKLLKHPNGSISIEEISITANALDPFLKDKIPNLSLKIGAEQKLTLYVSGLKEKIIISPLFEFLPSK